MAHSYYSHHNSISHNNHQNNSMRMGMTTYYRTMSIDNKITTIIIGPNGEPIKLPESLESLPKSDQFPGQRHRWNTNEEIASMLIAFDRHLEWLSKEVKIRPKSGSMLLYSRKKVRYRRDGYCWKKRKDGKTTREDHMKLKVQGMECIYGCYVHSAILPTFHRRCYWLLQNPDIVLVHYLNVPYPDDNKFIISSNVAIWGEKKEWTKEELISQLKPMFFSEEEPDLNNELEISTAETVNTIVTQLMEKQRTARADTINKKIECSCPDSTNPDKLCPHFCKTAEANNDISSRRSRSGRNVNTNSHQRMSPHITIHKQSQNISNHYYKTDSSYYASYAHVSSTSDFERCNKSGLKNEEKKINLLRTTEPIESETNLSTLMVATSPVASAVRTLSNLSEFGMNGVLNEGFDSYFINNDSLVSECAAKSEKQLPLLDFKSAFSDFETHKSSDISFNDTLEYEDANMHHNQLIDGHMTNNNYSSCAPKDPLEFMSSQSGSSSASSASSLSNHNFSDQQQFDVHGMESFDILKEFSDFHYLSNHSNPPNQLNVRCHEMHNPLHCSTEGGITFSSKNCSNSSARDHQHVSNSCSNFSWQNVMERECYSCRKRESSSSNNSVTPSKMRGLSNIDHQEDNQIQTGCSNYLNNDGTLQITDVISPSFYVWNNQQTVGH
ncbi:uncharacterized protein Camta isoform X2 [Lepeophtheirus salmonis]|uniref:uncharacterized protein Camta isoform X2 n=1 Tax=Lepeophtheirus salmonis TaxID=72036 RepID=UPI003AF3B68A